MTDKNLIELITDLNSGDADDYIFLRPLSQTVDFAIVWHHIIDQFTKVKSLFAPLRFYFIKNADNIYVGVVSELYSDLHWLVLPEYQGRGYLKKGLKETILPHLFQDGREEQKITINCKEIGEENFKASLRVAISVGFMETNKNLDKTEMKILNNVFSDVDYISGQNTLMPEERIDFLKNKAREFTKELLKIKSELEMKIGSKDEIDEMGDVLESVKKIPDLIHDAYYRNI